MKIVLLSPSPHYPKIFAYGPRILSSCLKQIGCDVRMIFLPRGVGEMYSDEVLSDLVALTAEADLIGISLMTDDLQNAILITTALRVHTRTPILWGGIHPTIEPESCLQHADMVCIGEGEETMVELVRKMRCGADFKQVPGIWARHNDQILRNPLRPLVQDLDSLPFPDYEKDDHYMLFEGTVQSITSDMLRVAFTEYFITLTSRGCPFQCTYCWNHSFRRLFPEGPVIRKRSISNVMEELTMIQKRFPYIQKMTIDDDAFFMRPLDEIREFAVAYRNSMHLPLWVTGATPTTLSREKLSLLSGAAPLSIRMGIQTASPRTKKLYRRVHSNEDVYQAVKLLSEFTGKIEHINFDIILDNPWETDEDVIETLRFLSHFPVPYGLFLFPLMFYPGTDLYDKALQEGILPLSEAEQTRVSNHQTRPTYLNHLFYILSINAQQGHRISPATMRLLTNRTLISSGIAQKLCDFVHHYHQGTLRDTLHLKLRTFLARNKLSFINIK